MTKINVQLVNHELFVELMRIHGYTVRSLADAVNLQLIKRRSDHRVTRSVIGHLRSGHRNNVTPEVAAAIARLFALPAASVLSSSGPKITVAWDMNAYSPVDPELGEACERHHDAPHRSGVGIYGTAAGERHFVQCMALQSDGSVRQYSKRGFADHDSAEEHLESVRERNARMSWKEVDPEAERKAAIYDDLKALGLLEQMGITE